MPPKKRSFEPILLLEEGVTKNALQANENPSGERQENGRRRVTPITGLINRPRRNQANNDEGNTK